MLQVIEDVYGLLPGFAGLLRIAGLAGVAQVGKGRRLEVPAAELPEDAECSPATAAGASSTQPGIEHWVVESTNPVSGTATLIARGPLTIGGTINLQTGLVKLPGGTLTLSHHQDWGRQSENPGTCLATVTSAGTYRLAGGTGRYRSVTGHGTYSQTAYAIAQKVNGKCAANVVPYAQTELLTADGPPPG